MYGKTLATQDMRFSYDQTARFPAGVRRWILLVAAIVFLMGAWPYVLKIRSENRLLQGSMSINVQSKV